MELPAGGQIEVVWRWQFITLGHYIFPEWKKLNMP